MYNDGKDSISHFAVAINALSGIPVQISVPNPLKIFFTKPARRIEKANEEG
jgi:hypothetical protein